MTIPNWKPTHTIPDAGLPARAEANASLEPLLRIRNGVEVQVIDTMGGWSKIRTDTGWEAWVDGTRLLALASGSEPAAAPPPPAA
ncbi:MAG: SH3 domain-containing protein, partial [Actinobacteria bacterium]|nr:SH3 domain-containing protein [Actinomycetota bacterium]